MVFLVINHFLDWTQILNSPNYLVIEISQLVFIVMTFFVIRFVLELIIKILMADQKSAISDSIKPVTNIISLISIYVLFKINSGSLLFLGIVLSGVPLFVILIASIILFNTIYNPYKPSFHSIEFKYFTQLAGLGLKFFVIQISYIIIFTTDNLIIAHIFTPAEVTPYNIAYKYFQVITILFGIIISPFWSAHTEAFLKKDYLWIKRMLRKLVIMMIPIILSVIIMILLGKVLIAIWVGKTVQIDLELLVYMGLFVIISAWDSIFASFLNGINATKMQLLVTILSGIINIPLSIYFAKYLGMGISGVILASSLSLSIFAVYAPIQTYSILRARNEK